jgi:hypothetical protein
VVSRIQPTAFLLVIGSLCWTGPFACAGSSDDSDLTQEWWMPKHYDTKSNQKGPSPSSTIANPQSESQQYNTLDSLSSAPVINANQVTKPDKDQTTEQPVFAVPNWFGQQPKPYVRANEYFRPANNFYGWGGNSLLAGGPYAGPAPLGSWPGGFWGGFGSPIGLGWGGWGGGWRGGWGGGWGGWGGWRGAWTGGWGWGGGFGWGGAFNPYWGGLGAGFAPGLGSFRSTGMFSTSVIQTEPSKASGNYYEPSTVDTTASGSYYASGTPAMTPAMPVKTSPKTYWDENSNPIPTNLR